MKNEICFVCGAAFTCGALDGGKCWCAELPLIVPYIDGATCLCPACLKVKIEAIEAHKAISAKTDPAQASHHTQRT
jgi:hypothetical protein